jgi:tetratricopeptide (TPR) repeat protein
MRSYLAAAALALVFPFESARAEAQTSTGPVRSDRTLFPNSGLQNPLVTEGDRMYTRRQEGRLGSKASAGPINQAIASYDRAAEARDQVEARWKLVRALYFKGLYTGLDPESRKAVFVKARRVSEDAIGILNKSLEDKGITGILELPPNLLAGKLEDRTDAAPVYFWAAAAWGQWALSMGKVEAAKTGAADKIRDYALTVVALDPRFEEGGGYRILGRLNDEAPWIPFITGWVSRDEALKSLRLAVQVDPQNFANRHYLAEALAKGNAEEKAEAVKLEEAILEQSPSPQHIVEDLSLQEAARANLAAWKKGA